jgi:hypothetical protein
MLSPTQRDGAKMSDTVSGIAALAVLALLVVVPIALSWHPRPPEAIVTRGAARGRGGMAIHPWRGHPAVVPLSWILAAGVLALGLWYVGSSPYAAVTFIVIGLYLLYIMWARATDRAGDGTLTLTPEGLHQRYSGSEVFVPWDAVRGLVTTRTDFIVETTMPIVPAQHMWSFRRRRRSVLTADAISLPRQNLPPLPYQEMVELYSTTPAARDELATEEPVRRARDMLRTPLP